MAEDDRLTADRFSLCCWFVTTGFQQFKVSLSLLQCLVILRLRAQMCQFRVRSRSLSVDNCLNREITLFKHQNWHHFIYKFIQMLYQRDSLELPTCCNEYFYASLARILKLICRLRCITTWTSCLLRTVLLYQSMNTYIRIQVVYKHSHSTVMHHLIRRMIES